MEQFPSSSLDGDDAVAPPTSSLRGNEIAPPHAMEEADLSAFLRARELLDAPAVEENIGEYPALSSLSADQPIAEQSADQVMPSPPIIIFFLLHRKCGGAFFSVDNVSERAVHCIPDHLLHIARLSTHLRPLLFLHYHL